MKNFLKNTAEGIAAGVMVSIGGFVFLACENKVVGAVLFSVALLCICFKGYSLYTGKVGYLAHSHTGKDFAVLFTGLLGNLLGAVLMALVAHLSGLAGIASINPEALATAKISQMPYETFLRAFLCGILMYLAVWIFREKKSSIGIIFCIPVFILSGFEHSIADMFYLFTGVPFILMNSTGAFETVLKSLLFLLMAVLGNSAGAIFIALFDKTKKEG